MERDSKVVYRLRTDDGENRLPTALDPVRYPEDRAELKRAVARAHAENARRHGDDERYGGPSRQASVRDDTSEFATRGAGFTKTTYSVRDRGVEKESVVSSARGGVARAAYVEDDARGERTRLTRESLSALPRAATVVEEERRPAARERDDRDMYRSKTFSPPYREYYSGDYDIERPTRNSGAYVIDTRRGEDYDILVGDRALNHDRGYGGFRRDDYVEDTRGSYRSPPPRTSRSAYIDDIRSSASSVHSKRGPYMSGARAVDTTVARPEVRSAKVRGARGEDEEEYVKVERLEIRERAPSIHETFKDPFDGPPRRARSITIKKASSEEDFVMVSPPRRSRAQSRPPDGTSLRSAILTEDKYSPEERLRRRRSRSINFREKQVRDHMCGDRYHEPPGAEAAMSGKYLEHYEVDAEAEKDKTVISRSDRHRDDEDRSRYDYEYRDVIRRDPRPIERKRSKSRRRRKSESDDESYVSRKVERTTKTTYY